MTVKGQEGQAEPRCMQRRQDGETAGREQRPQGLGPEYSLTGAIEGVPATTAGKKHCRARAGGCVK